MKYKHIARTLGAFAFLLTPLSAWAGDVPPADSKPLSEILKAVEQQKLGVISESEFDNDFWELNDGFWKVKVCNAGACQKLYIDPKSGTEKRRRKTDSDDIAPTDAMPLSAIVQAVEASGLGIITEVEFDDGYWKLELRKDARKIKLALDPRTGAPR
ncbi:hypothetical protein AGMMS50289_18700 [Betaproteobacteria bacterium]|nr:hypothetical protein AGMMS50289_18700 [Betaproteobacteria bacterium]